MALGVPTSRSGGLAVAAVAAVAVLSGCAGAEPAGAPPSTEKSGTSAESSAGVDTLGPEDLVTRLEDPEVVVLDVRTPAEFAAGHVAGARNVDVQSPDFDARLAALDPEATYVVYCRSGNRSQVAAEAMTAAGFADVANVEAGLVTLQQADVPLVLGPQ